METEIKDPETEYVSAINMALHVIKTMLWGFNSNILRFHRLADENDFQEAKEQADRIRRTGNDVMVLADCVDLVMKLRLLEIGKIQEFDLKYLTNTGLFSENNSEVSLEKILNEISGSEMTVNFKNPIIDFKSKLLALPPTFLQYQGAKPTALFFDYFLRASILEIQNWYGKRSSHDLSLEKVTVFRDIAHSSLVIQSPSRKTPRKDMQGLAKDNLDQFELLRKIVHTLRIGEISLDDRKGFFEIRLASYR